MRLFFLPPYRPKLNPTEYPNNAVKGGGPRLQWPRDQRPSHRRARLRLRVIQQRPYLGRRFFRAEPVRYAA